MAQAIISRGAILFWFMLLSGAFLWRGVLESGSIGGSQGSMGVVCGHSEVTEKSQHCGGQDSNLYSSWISLTRRRHTSNSATVSRGRRQYSRQVADRLEVWLVPV